MESTRSVLIIDDEANLRRSLSVILQRAGYSVTTTGGAQDAWLALETSSFDLVLLDIKMPGISGLDLLPQICQKYPDVAVVLITAHATLESAIEAVRRGARDYLLKPINPAQLLSRLAELFANKNQTRRQREILAEMQNLMHEFGHLGTAESGPKSRPGSVLVQDQTRILRCGLFSLDLHARTVHMNGLSVSLSPTAFNYLVTLIRHSPQTVDYETLVMEAQGFETTPIEAYEMARWRIHELRKALEADSRHPQYIITIRGIGYRLLTDATVEGG
jgi:DNA-binding response OmpR family regulator